VASGLVSFSLGTDTAGSGRVPAGFNNIIGLKPTCGNLSARGVVPACRSIDCLSIFALTADDAARVLAVASGYDPADAYSRKGLSVGVAAASAARGFRFGVPRADQLEFFGDGEYARLFSEAVARLESLGGERVTIDFAPFRAAARLLYEGAFIAERYVAVGDFIDRQPDSVHPVTRQLIAASRDLTAADAFRSQHRLMEAKRAAAEAWGDIDVLVTPTAGTIYRIADVNADPIRLNSNLGFYTNFVNFLDFAAVAVPAGLRKDGLPFGVTLVGAAWTEAQLLALADRMHRASVDKLGALAAPLPASSGTAVAPPAAGLTPVGATLAAAPIAATRSAPSAPALASSSTQVGATSATAPPRSPSSAAPSPSSRAIPPVDAQPGRIPVAVCGAHLEGLPLNPQLTSRGATLVSRTRTAPAYRFYALPGGPPFRPGLVRVATGGAAIDVEVWSVPAEHFGSFVAGIPTPLGIGKVELEDGTRVPGFICESHGIEGAKDITSFGNWRAYLKSLSP
jgi:allophanate hydrolase